MPNYQVDLSMFAPPVHRIVKSWYSWQEVYLRKLGSYPGKNEREPRGRETQEEVFWGGRPPVMINDRELRFFDDLELSYYLVFEDNLNYIDGMSRGSRRRYMMFRRFEDAEKYMLFLISQAARPGYYEDSPGFRWYKQGLHPRVSLSKPDPINHPGRVSITVDQEATDRGWMSEHDAIAASHAIVLSFEELDAVLRQGVPPAWFTINVIGD
ncbi:hypothetical protein LAUMK13_05327 [Mycobacterium innocens]|uniref:Immunity factor for TNT n=1 Tax=Mycobacterium innocens TaxID=2341083 RepID=A0A498QJX9_9MYCO|nr:MULTISPECIES: hypothetical protein [Mycobacterium]VBA45051.1 hypothetical protein LAUMK13_05327 [Mycobacterium innocens]